ncbi:Microtubule-associated protein, microtubule dynamics during spindle orientation [Arthrobotrys musiformis]|uniref:Microtubule-associated protein, microtubule dynamics during spindle orientation n=1 Tax=Arthrobotrys musiformis TaxID=47236 RepID=A0AAV9WCP3_9PEZI
MADPEEDYSSLPLADRVTHKIWKVRKQAYEDTTKEFERSGSETDSCFRLWLNDASIWKGIVADSNVAAQLEGINCLHAFLQFGGQNAGVRSRPHTIPALAEKGIVSTKAATKAKAIDVLLLYVELDTPTPIIEDLLPFLSHKMPKVVAATTNVLFAIYREFGAKTANPKPVLQQLPKLFAHGDKNVRAEAVSLTVELYKWLKDGMKPMFFNDLKPVQQKELDEAFEKVKGEPAKQTRLLRSQQAALAESAAAENGDEADEPEGEPDTFDLFEPVDVSGKISKDFWDQINSSKWKDRKESLDMLYGIVNVPRIKEEDFSELIRILAKSMKDANITVVIVAANCVECIAKGLRSAFAKYRPIIFVPTAERLKEKKQAVADALGAALDGIFNSTSLTDILEDTMELLRNKNPQVKLESLRFLIRCLKNTRVAPSKSEVKMITDTVTKLLADTLEATRTAAAEAMGTLMKIMGERAMNPYIDGLDEIRKSKIKEFFESAQVKAKDKPPAPAPPAAAPSKPPLKKKVAAKAPVAQSQPSRASAPTTTGAGRGASDEGATPAKKVPAVQKLVPKPQVSKLGRKPQPGLTSPTRSAVADDNTITNPPSHPKLGLGNRGGLTSRTLQAPQSNGKAVEVLRATDSPSFAAEKAELERLRSERENWLTENMSYRAEKEKLLHELSDIRLQNAQLIEEHTRDVLSIKAKETQLLRLRSDLQTAEENLDKKQREVDRLKRELARFSRASSPAATDLGDALTHESFGGYPRDRTVSATSISGIGEHGQRASALSRPRNRSSLAGSSYGLDDGPSMYPSRDSMRSPISDSGSSRDKLQGQKSESEIRTGEIADPNENWKRAAQVTSQLKMRIEQMKARQHMRGVS